jgi:F420-dependent oxidoreductase-like protein
MPSFYRTHAGRSLAIRVMADDDAAMRFSFWPNAAQSWSDILATAQHAERSGWDGVYVADHFLPSIGDDSGPTLECWGLMAGLAAAVPRVRIGSLVCGNTYRHPAVLANQAATVDQISGGRLVLGLGAGWQENEHDAYGIPLPTPGPRLDRLEEACEIVKGLLTQPRTTFEGSYYTVRDAPCEPKPVQDSLPLLIGGGGEKRTLRIAARFADEWNVWGTPDVLAQKGSVLERHCTDVGRDPSQIAHSAQALLFMSDNDEFLDRIRNAEVPRPMVLGGVKEVTDTLGRYVDAGVDEFIVPDFTLPAAGTQRWEIMDRFIDEAAAPLRG